jgi:hypothetical protein
MHTLSLDLAGTGLALPAGHAMHDALLEAPEMLLNVPTGQTSKVIEALMAPTLAQKPPTGHRLHAVAPGVALKEPAGHALQLLSPLCALNVPGLHGTGAGA